MRVVWWMRVSDAALAATHSQWESVRRALTQSSDVQIDVIDVSRLGKVAALRALVVAARSSDLIHFTDGAQGSRPWAFLATLLGTPTLDVTADELLQGAALAKENPDSNGISMADHVRSIYANALNRDQLRILGVPIKVTSRSKAVAHIDQAIESRHPVHVAFANAHTLNLAATSIAYRDTLQGFYVLNDGLGVDLASRWKIGRRFADNLNGTDFVPHYLDTTHHDLRIYLVGSSEEVAETAARRIEQRWPRHSIVGARHGFFSGTEEEAEIARKIRLARADVVLVGMGNPLQETWIACHGAQTGAAALFGVGAFLDFTSGRVTRAPKLVRDLRCEWLWRLAREPKRLWRRYVLGNALFLVRVLRDTSASELR